MGRKVITEETVREIVRLHKQDLSGSEIARRIGLSAEAVNRLLRQPRMAQQEGRDHFCDSTEQIQMCLTCPFPDCKASGRLCPLKEGKTP